MRGRRKGKISKISLAVLFVGSAAGIFWSKLADTFTARPTQLLIAAIVLSALFVYLATRDMQEPAPRPVAATPARRVTALLTVTVSCLALAVLPLTFGDTPPPVGLEPSGSPASASPAPTVTASASATARPTSTPRPGPQPTMSRSPNPSEMPSDVSVRQLGHNGEVMGIAFAVGSTSMAAVDHSGQMKVWNPSTGGAHTVTVSTEALFVEAVACSAVQPRRCVTGGADGRARLWNLGTSPPTMLRELQETPGGKSHLDSWILSVAYSPDGSMVASAADDKLVKIWDTATGALRARFEESDDSVKAVAFADNDLLAMAKGYGVISVRSVSSKEELATFSCGATVTAISFDPARRLAVACGTAVLICGPQTQHCVTSLAAQASAVSAVAFSPDGRYLAAGFDDGTIKVWHVDSPEQVKVLKEHTLEVTGLSWSPDGTSLASASRDKSVRLW